MGDMYNKIEMLCRAKGINISEMCRESGAPRGSLTDLKMGRTTGLSVKNSRKIAEYFSVPVEYLYEDGDASVISASDHSVVMQGNTGNNNVALGDVNAGGEPLSDMEKELLRIFRGLDMRKKNVLMSRAYEIEDSMSKEV